MVRGQGSVTARGAGTVGWTRCWGRMNRVARQGGALRGRSPCTREGRRHDRPTVPAMHQTHSHRVIRVGEGGGLVFSGQAVCATSPIWGLWHCRRRDGAALETCGRQRTSRQAHSYGPGHCSSSLPVGITHRDRSRMRTAVRHGARPRYAYGRSRLFADDERCS